MTVKPGQYFWQGNEACVEGAIAAGCRFFAGYPITPATEISERMANRMPPAGGFFAQGEDELASLAMVIGASHAGAKAMTASSGNGISLMQEEIGYACLSETPCVIVDCQRVGTGTGIATKSMQGDVYQVRYGSNGDYSVIALAPASVQEMFDLTIKAFNLAEAYRTPVFILADEITAHLREKVTVPPQEEIAIVNRKRPVNQQEGYIPFKVDSETGVPLMASFGEGYRLPISGFIHTETGAPTTQYEETRAMLGRLWHKIEKRVDDIALSELDIPQGARVAVVSYGSVSRPVQSAVKNLNKGGFPTAHLRLITIWPFPDRIIENLARQVDYILVPEMNMGKMVREVARAAGGLAEVAGFSKPGVELHRPAEIEEMIKKVMK